MYGNYEELSFLGLILLFNASATGALSSVVLGNRTMDGFFKDGVIFNFELGFEVGQFGSIGGAVGATTYLGHVVPIVLNFFAWRAPTKNSMSYGIWRERRQRNSVV